MATGAVCINASQASTNPTAIFSKTTSGRILDINGSANSSNLLTGLNIDVTNTGDGGADAIMTNGGIVSFNYSSSTNDIFMDATYTSNSSTGDEILFLTSFISSAPRTSDNSILNSFWPIVKTFVPNSLFFCSLL